MLLLSIPALHAQVLMPTTNSLSMLALLLAAEDRAAPPALPCWLSCPAAEYFEDRTDVQCLHRWTKVLNPAVHKRPWTREEDDAIQRLVAQYGTKQWTVVAEHLPGRISKQCRER